MYRPVSSKTNEFRHYSDTVNRGIDFSTSKIGTDIYRLRVQIVEPIDES